MRCVYRSDFMGGNLVGDRQDYCVVFGAVFAIGLADYATFTSTLALSGLGGGSNRGKVTLPNLSNCRALTNADMM